MSPPLFVALAAKNRRTHGMPRAFLCRPARGGLIWAFPLNELPEPADDSGGAVLPMQVALRCFSSQKRSLSCRNACSARYRRCNCSIRFSVAYRCNPRPM